MPVQTNGRRIAVVTMDVRLANEQKGLDRTAFIAGILADAGYTVDLITSSFQHWEKAQRDTSDPGYRSQGFNIVFIDAPSYAKNLDFARIRNHSLVTKRVSAYFRAHPDYDMVIAKIPPNDLSLACARFAKSAGIPFVVDVNDLWPEAMHMVFDVPVISDAVFHPFMRDAEETYRLTTAAIGTSDEYAHRPVKRTHRTIECLTVYVGNDVARFDEEAAQHAHEVEKPAGEFWVSYAGTLATSYDIKTMVRASALLKQRGHDEVRMMIMGGGPDADTLKRAAAECDCNVTFLGYLPHAQMAAYLTRSDVLVNSFVKRAPQSIVSKVADYLAAGKPMINTLANPEFQRKVEDDGFGVNVEPEDPEALAAAIIALIEDPAARARMGAAARRTSESQFDRPRSYKRIVDLVDRLLSVQR